MSDDHLTCEEVIGRLFAYLDGELGEAERADFERHFERCRDCFSRADFERRLKAKLAEAGNATPPERLRERVRMMIARF